MSLPQTYKALKSQGLNLDPKIEELPLPKPGKNEVLIKMAFAPLNIIDIGIMYGRFPTAPPPHLVGLEGSGTIVAVGEDLKVPKQVGDKVLVSAANPGGSYRCGTFGEYVLVSAETCPKVPEGVSMEDAASGFINPTTVYYMYELARRGGHKAVIHDVGASQVGRMLIRLLKLKGIKSINIVRKADYIEELKKEGADYVLNSQDPDFESKLKEIATNEKATISFDAISGSYPALLLKNQPPGSICYVYGLLSGEFTVKDISIGDLFQKKKIAGLVCREHGAERYEKGELQAYFKEIGDLLSTVYKTNILKTFTLEEWKEALDFTRKNNEGKVLFRFE